MTNFTRLICPSCRRFHSHSQDCTCDLSEGSLCGDPSVGNPPCQGRLLVISEASFTYMINSDQRMSRLQRLLETGTGPTPNDVAVLTARVHQKRLELARLEEQLDDEFEEMKFCTMTAVQRKWIIDRGRCQGITSKGSQCDNTSDSIGIEVCNDGDFFGIVFVEGVTDRCHRHGGRAKAALKAALEKQQQERRNLRAAKKAGA